MKFLKILLLFNVLFFLHAHAKNAILAIEKTANSSLVDVNGTIIYNITITNSGDENAVDITVLDTLPSGTDFVSVTGSSFTCGSSGLTVTCTDGSVAKGDKTDTIVITAKAPNTEGAITNTATVSGGGTDAVITNNTASATVLVKELSGDCHDHAVDFLTIDDSYGQDPSFIGHSTSGSNEEVYLQITAISNPDGSDVNGTLLTNVYSPSWDNLNTIQLLDGNCNVLQDYSGSQAVSFSQWLGDSGVWYIRVDASQAQYVVASLFYPDFDSSSNSGGGGIILPNEPAIYQAYDESDNLPAKGDINIQTKIVNKPFNITVAAVNTTAWSLLTKYKANFVLELIDGDQECQGTYGISLKEFPTLFIKSGGYATLMDISYDKAVKNVKFRMEYLANPGDGGLIDYNDLVSTNICLNNTQSCLWGVLTNMESTKTDPFLPDFSIADVCGIYCDPGGGTGNNQITDECRDCVFGFAVADCSDNFAIRPDKFDVNITSGDIFKAGKATSLAFKALDGNTTQAPTLDYDEIENTSFRVDINISDSSKICQKPNIGMTPNVDFEDGLDEGSFVFDDIGDVNMTIHEINGSEFAIVDADDTDDAQRLITEHNVSFTIIPDHFKIEANLTDHNNVDNFTYLHDINRYDSDDNYSMAAKLNISIEAVGVKPDENITRNYTEECYAKDTNLTLVLGGTNITYPGTIPALTQFLYYNPLEDDGTNDGEGEHNFTTPITSPISIASLPIENNIASFPADAPDGNGTTDIKYKLNFDRKQDLVVNPFKVVLTDVNIIDEDNVIGSAIATAGTALLDQNASMYYARTRASKFFYEDITENNVTTPILVDVYCDFIPTSGCDILDNIDTVSGEIDERYWWLSLGHNEDNGDGNITLIEGAIIEGASGDWSVTHDVDIIANSQDKNVMVTNGTAPTLPLTVIIDLDTSDPTDTNLWLIYNKDDDTLIPTPFYKVRFIGDSSWTGVGITGDVINTNASRKKSKRMDW